MKQKGIIIIMVAVFVAGFASLFISRKLFAKDGDRKVEVKVVEEITTDFSTPNKQFFNEKSINPTQIITIGNTPASQPTQESEQR